MIKSEIKTNVKTERKYPYIGIDKDGVVILFTGPRTGTCLKCNYGIGSYSEGWKENNCVPLNGEIILRNEP